MTVSQQSYLYMAELLTELIGAFAVSLLFAALWLIVCKIIPPMRRRVGVSYSVAIVLAFLPPLIRLGGPNYIGLWAALLCVGLLFWDYKRTIARVEGGTSISRPFHH